MLITLETGRRESRILGIFDQHVMSALLGELCNDAGIVRSVAGLLARTFTESAVAEESVTRQVMPPIQIAEWEATEC